MSFHLYNQDGRLVRADGYYNDDTGYGGASDSIKNTRYLTDAPLDQYELEALYDARDSIARRGTDIPVDDRLSKGVEFITNNDDSESRKREIEELEKDMKALSAIDNLMLGEKWARLFGGGLLYFDYGDEQPLPQSVSIDGLNPSGISFELPDNRRTSGLPFKIWVVDRWMATPMSYYKEATHGKDHPKLGEVESYSVVLQTTGYSRLVFAHESRVVKLDGLPLPPRLKAERHMWGGSVVQNAYDEIKYFGVGRKALADTLEDFNWKTLEIENLPDLIASQKAEDLMALTKSASLAAKNYHNQSIGLHGTGTKLMKHATTVTGLTDIVDLFSAYVAASFHPGIPDSLFFAAKGGALAGSSADADIKNYYKRLSMLQENRDRAHIERIIFLLGRDPENFPFVFPPLEEATEKEKIEARKGQAEVDEKYINAQVLAPQEVRTSRFSKPEPQLDQVIIDPELDEMLEVDEDDLKPEEAPEEIIDDVEEDNETE